MIPYMMNCEHQGSGWCLDCVEKLGSDFAGFRATVADALAKCKRNLADTLTPNGARNEADRLYDAATRAAMGEIDATIAELGLQGKTDVFNL